MHGHLYCIVTEKNPYLPLDESFLVWTTPTLWKSECEWMVTYPYQDVAACMVAWYRMWFCANLPASFVVYPSLGCSVAYINFAFLDFPPPPPPPWNSQCSSVQEVLVSILYGYFLERTTHQPLRSTFTNCKGCNKTTYESINCIVFIFIIL